MADVLTCYRAWSFVSSSFLSSSRSFSLAITDAPFYFPLPLSLSPSLFIHLISSILNSLSPGELYFFINKIDIGTQWITITKSFIVDNSCDPSLIYKDILSGVNLYSHKYDIKPSHKVLLTFIKLN